MGHDMPPSHYHDENRVDYDDYGNDDDDDDDDYILMMTRTMTKTCVMGEPLGCSFHSPILPVVPGDFIFKYDFIPI